MTKYQIIVEGKRPLDATPERALELSQTMKQTEIAKMWGISKQRVNQLIKKAKGKQH
jgi:DNA-directed RNA polymerase specialized sigma subunit